MRINRYFLKNLITDKTFLITGKYYQNIYVFKHPEENLRGFCRPSNLIPAFQRSVLLHDGPGRLIVHGHLRYSALPERHLDIGG